MQTINILNQASTFDLTEWEITNYSYKDRVFFCQSKQVFKFDKCKGIVMCSNKILEENADESRLVKNVISNTIPAGYVGKLLFKIELTDLLFFQRQPRNKYQFYEPPEGKEELAKFQKLIQDSVQIDLNPFPRNYYNGTNQTDLEPAVVFTSGNSPMELDNEAFIRGFYRGLSEKEVFQGDVREDSVRLTDGEFDTLVDELDQSNKSNLSMEETIEFANQVVKEVRKISLDKN